VTRLAVFVATTSGPVRIERITRERAPQSMVCLRRSSTVLPISAAYDSFVRLGSGVIEKTFGPFEDGAFRLDVSDPIETGESWQLGAFVAHALASGRKTSLLGAQDTAEAIVWLTGRVDCDLAVGSVGHLPEKVHASREAIAAWVALGSKVTMIVPEGADHEAVRAAGIPDGVRLFPVRGAADALRELGVTQPQASAPRKRFPAWAAAAAVVLGLAGFSFFSWPERDVQTASAPVERMEPVALESAAVPVEIPAPAAAEDVDVIKAQPTPEPPKVAILERRAPAGHTCAEVQFGAVDAVKVAVTDAAEVSSSRLQGLCGLALAVDNGAREHFVALVVDVVSGKLLYGTTRPDIFGGETAFDGRHEWPIDLPRRLSEPFEIRVAAISAESAVSEQAQWFDTQADASAAAKELSEKGVATAMLHHRVMP
jgi:hypothetical protein